jgi:hypothetical protein
VPSDPIRDHEDPAITNSTSDAAWTVSRTPSMLIPEEWHASGFDSRLIRFRCVSRGLLALASLNHTCRNLVPTFPQRSPPLLVTTAACGGLRSTPDCRPRRAFLHLSYSYAPPYGPALRVTQCHKRSWRYHSITSSARAVNAAGKVIPSAVAVFKLTAKSKRDDCRIGNSAGLAP